MLFRLIAESIRSSSVKRHTLLSLIMSEMAAEHLSHGSTICGTWCGMYFYAKEYFDPVYNQIYVVTVDVT